MCVVRHVFFLAPFVVLESPVNSRSASDVIRIRCLLFRLKRAKQKTILWFSSSFLFFAQKTKKQKQKRLPGAYRGRSPSGNVTAFKATDRVMPDK